MTLKTDMADDLAAVFFNTDDFSEDVFIFPADGGVPRTIAAIFDDPYRDVAGVESSAPAMVCAVSDLAGVKLNDRVERTNADAALNPDVYYITKIDRDMDNLIATVSLSRDYAYGR